jgi:hypothetical protein
MLYFDRFDIVEAYYLAYTHCHNGQYSSEYSRLCRIQKYFKPSCNLSVNSLSENGREIYIKLTNKLLGA